MFCRLLDSAYAGDGVRGISFWTSCDADGDELKASRYWYPGDDHYIDKPVYKPVEDPLPLMEDDIQNLCYMVHQFDEDASVKLANIHGDASVAAVRIAGCDGKR